MTEVDTFDVQDELLKSVVNEFPENVRDTFRYTQYYRLLESLTYEAARYCKENNENIRWLNNHIREVLDGLVNAITYSTERIFNDDFVETEESIKETYNLWRHKSKIFDEAKTSNKMLPVDLESLQLVIEDYLRLPIRSSEFDRLLVDILIGTETYNFISQMYNAPKVPLFPKMSPLQYPHPLIHFFKGRFFSAIFWGVLAWIAYIAGDKSWLNQDTAVVLVMIFAIMWVLMSIYRLFILPSNWKRIQEGKNKVHELADEMLSLYKQLFHNGTLSAKHILARAESSTDKGVVWPTALFTLLDDIIERGGKF